MPDGQPADGTSESSEGETYGMNRLRLSTPLVTLFTAIGMLIPVEARAAEDSPHATGAGAGESRILRMYRRYKREAYAGVPDISVSHLIAGRDSSGMVVVDARPTEERKVSMIPGAITRDEFERHRGQYRDSMIVVYCTIGYRSGEYTGELREKGFEAYNLIGGVLSWAHAGRTFVAEDGEHTKKVHVYGRKWNLLPDDYEGVW
jgi:rhodanese-related sulfurtransferase